MAVMDLILVATAVVISILVYLLLRRSLGELLDDVVKLPAARKFFQRTLLMAMLLAALAGALQGSFSTEEDTSFMETVWDLATSLESVFWALMVVLLIYVVLQTVLVAALRRRHEQ